MAHDTYCALIVTKNSFSDKCDLTVDIGQQTNPEYDEALKAYISEIDGLNYMAGQGWELVTSYMNQNVFVSKHILRKRG